MGMVTIRPMKMVMTGGWFIEFIVVFTTHISLSIDRKDMTRWTCGNERRLSLNYHLLLENPLVNIV